MTYVKKGTKKLRRALAFKDWRRFISGKEKWQSKLLRNKIIKEMTDNELINL